jgi:hypothetical protein
LGNVYGLNNISHNPNGFNNNRYGRIKINKKQLITHFNQKNYAYFFYTHNSSRPKAGVNRPVMKFLILNNFIKFYYYYHTVYDEKYTKSHRR